MNSISGGSGGIDKYIGFLGAMDVGSRCMISDCQVLKIKLFLSSTIMQLIRGRRVLNQIIRLPKYPVCLEHLRCININQCKAEISTTSTQRHVKPTACNTFATSIPSAKPSSRLNHSNSRCLNQSTTPEGLGP